MIVILYFIFAYVLFFFLGDSTYKNEKVLLPVLNLIVFIPFTAIFSFYFQHLEMITYLKNKKYIINALRISLVPYLIFFVEIYNIERIELVHILVLMFLIVIYMLGAGDRISKMMFHSFSKKDKEIFFSNYPPKQVSDMVGFHLLILFSALLPILYSQIK